MALPPAAALREHIRHVYRQAGLLGISASAYLDQLAETALAAQRSGKTLQSAGSAGTNTSYYVFQRFSPDDVLELIDALRTYCAKATVDLALAELAATAVGIRSYRPNFSEAIIR